MKLFTGIQLTLLACTVSVSTCALSLNIPTHAITSVDELVDVQESHWAFDALRDLVEKYDV